MEKKEKSNFLDRNVPKTATHLLSYLGCIGMALFVTYYLDGTVGIMMTTALLLALVLSFLTTVFALRSVSVEISADRSVLTKGETIRCTVRLRNTKPFLTPTLPAVEVVTDCSPHFSADNSGKYLGAIAGRNDNIIRINMTALHSGAGSVFVRSVTLTDYLGIFSFRLKVPEEQLRFETAIYPDIPDAPAQISFLRTTSQFSSSDDDEEESDETAMTPTGLPGYDHREYVPGDPIKRINWKLSSKRDVYMVRLDEQIRGSGQVFLFDCPDIEENDRSLTVRDNVIEGALLLLTLVSREGREADFWYCKGGLWLNVEIHNPGDVYLLQEEMSDFRPSKPPEIVPKELLTSGKTPICFTASLDGASASQVLELCPGAMVISALSSDVPQLTGEHYTVSDEFDFKKYSL